MAKIDLKSVSIEELWALHQEIGSVLSAKVQAEKLKLENWLERLNAKVSDQVQERRPYPKLHPRFRNPDPPHQTWSGRGNQPLWMRKLSARGRMLDNLGI